MILIFWKIRKGIVGDKSRRKCETVWDDWGVGVLIW
jgi:hypothetical protein